MTKIYMAIRYPKNWTGKTNSSVPQGEGARLYGSG